jgi:hypothetical protein
MEIDEGELHTLYKKCCREDLDHLRIVLTAWANGKISKRDIKKKIKDKQEFHTIYGSF